MKTDTKRTEGMLRSADSFVAKKVGPEYSAELTYTKSESGMFFVLTYCVMDVNKKHVSTVEINARQGSKHWTCNINFWILKDL